jgi:putative tryptophan/tyrosine transport system substrate-binding protein
MQVDQVNRREFIITVGAAAAWPTTARAQQPALPAIGFLDSRSPDALADRLRGFRQGLGESGYVEGDNVRVVYSWAENKMDRLPELAAELVRRQVSVIITGGSTASIFAAKAATAKVPIIFLVSDDPVRLGLVASLARPGGNLTGINFLNSELAAKQLELLHELVPRAARVGVFVNPANPLTTEAAVDRDAAPAARAMGLQLQVLRASSGREIDAAFATFAREAPDALFILNDGFFNSRRVQFVQQAAYHRLPALYAGREYCEHGGLMSYGSNITDAYRQVGVYAGQILKGAKPADLPVVQSSKFELVINAQTARVLGLTVPQTLLVAADEVIE